MEIEVRLKGSWRNRPIVSKVLFSSLGRNPVEMAYNGMLHLADNVVEVITQLIPPLPV